MAMAADAVGITAIARPRGNAAADIQSVLDRGVAGVRIPHIETVMVRFSNGVMGRIT
jgi:2-keto-3-deoxy-L-rhamnonate aldolase RhmA